MNNLSKNLEGERGLLREEEEESGSSRAAELVVLMGLGPGEISGTSGRLGKVAVWSRDSPGEAPKSSMGMAWLRLIPLESMDGLDDL